MKKNIIDKELISLNDSLAFTCGWLRRIDQTIDAIKRDIVQIKTQLEKDPVVACKKRMKIYAADGLKNQSALEKYHKTRKCKNH